MRHVRLGGGGKGGKERFIREGFSDDFLCLFLFIGEKRRGEPHNSPVITPEGSIFRPSSSNFGEAGGEETLVILTIYTPLPPNPPSPPLASPLPS